MARPPGSFIWYELMTSDANAAAKFYGAVIGWKIPERADPQAAGGQDYRMILRSDDGNAGGVLQLNADMVKGGASSTWLGYLQVNNVDAAVKAIEADGGRTVMPKRTLPVGDIAMVADPMGTPFYVMAPIPPPGQPTQASDVFDAKASQHVRWNELASPDLDRAKAFYAKHFGFEFNEVMPMGPMGDYCFIDHGGRRLGAIMPQQDKANPAAWLLYFGVDSVAQAGRAIQANGGKITLASHQVPGGDWILTAIDPQGAPFGVVGNQGN